jgi:hypothetical protein
MRRVLLTLARINYWRKALPKLSLLPLRFSLLLQFPCLLLGTRAWGSAGRQKNDNGPREEQERDNSFHKE